MISAPGISGKISQLCGTNGTVRQTAAHVIKAAPDRQQHRQVEHGERRQRAEQAQHRHGAGVAVDGKRWREQRRQARRVNRVDHLVAARGAGNPGAGRPPKYSR